MSSEIKQAPNIFLTGFMGAGKTTIGRGVAKHLGFEFCDIDDLIEQKTGKTVTEIFRHDGESFFRMLEKQILEDCVQKHNVVVSLGGGTLLDANNVTAVKRNGILIYLSAESEVIWSRIKGTNKRPLLLNADGKLVTDTEAVQHINGLLSVRQEGYSFADIVIPTDTMNNEEVLALILNYTSNIG